MARKQKLKIISLGGLNEIGKNMTVLEYGSSIIVIDCGLAFPDDDMPGIDLVIPDVSYLIKNKEKVKGFVITHGHEDHIGGLPYVLKDLNVPVYGTPLTLGILERKLKERGMLSHVKLNVVNASEKIKFDDFTVEFIRTNHSIADSVALAITTPVGVVVHTGDFKIDTTPISGSMMDLTRFGELGNKGILLLMSDSTNAERPGYSLSESTVGISFDHIFEGTDKRIIIATFASNVHRVQQIINAAAKVNRKVAISGRSMINIVSVAMQLGYMSIPEGTLIDLDNVPKYPKERLCIITTGSQGEAMAALTRMAFSDHKKITIGSSDLVILSAHPIPGNEKFVSRVVDELFKHGAQVIYDTVAEVHVSGHACSEELKMILALTKPKYFIPVHGEYRHLHKHADLAEKTGIPRSNIFINDIGKVIELTQNTAKFNGTVASGKVLVDGLGVGDVGNIVLRDRKHLAQDGLIVVIVTLSSDNCNLISGPDIISRGFVYVRESESLMNDMKNIVRQVLSESENKRLKDWNTLKGLIKNALNEYIYEKTKRNPMILPVIMEI